MVPMIIELIRTIRNAIDYPLRRLFRWRWKGLQLKQESKEDTFTEFGEADRRDVTSRVALFRQKYHLDLLYKESSKANYRINLYYVEMLEKALDISGCSLPDAINVADIGASHWFYVRALYAVMRWWRQPVGRTVRLSGYEVDAYRVYGDLYSRYDYAEAYIGGLEGVHYIDTAFKRQVDIFDVIVVLFPFILKEDHLKWGLPGHHYQPQKLLDDAWKSLNPGGLLVIANQGEREKAAQEKLLQMANFSSWRGFQFQSLFYRYPISHHVWVIEK